MITLGTHFFCNLKGNSISCSFLGWISNFNHFRRAAEDHMGCVIFSKSYEQQLLEFFFQSVCLRSIPNLCIFCDLRFYVYCIVVYKQLILFILVQSLYLFDKLEKTKLWTSPYTFYSPLVEFSNSRKCKVFFCVSHRRQFNVFHSMRAFGCTIISKICQTFLATGYILTSLLECKKGILCKICEL